MGNGVYAVVVVYAAAPAEVAMRLQGLAGQVDAIVVVDNTSARDPERWSHLALGRVTCLMNGHNTGAAGGFNCGMRAALEAGARFVLLLDDDSAPEASMVDALLDAWQKLTANGQRVAAVGPDFTDRLSGERGLFARFDGWRVRRRQCTGEEPFVRTDLLMSSGSLISADALRGVGFLEEGLFVDLVDAEWCLRARARGYACYGVCAAKMTHAFGGGGGLRLPGGRVLPGRPPLRAYYAFRNALLLLPRRYLPLAWKLVVLRRMAALLLLNAAAGRFEHVRMMLLGIGHGVLRRTGPWPA